jgi:hypothetical protein
MLVNLNHLMQLSARGDLFRNVPFSQPYQRLSIKQEFTEQLLYS